LKTKIEFDKPSVPCARGADLSDELLVSTSQNQGCHQFATFDAAIVKRHTKFAFVPKQ
jgi:predicted nucleic-acid-binding protein